MRIHRTGRIDPDTAEKLLAGRPLGPDAGHDALADLVAALAAPAADGEQPGERAVLAAFREKRLSPVQPLGRSRMTVAAPARRLSAKALVAALATTAVCGAGVAAGAPRGAVPRRRGGRRLQPSPPPERSANAPPSRARSGAQPPDQSPARWRVPPQPRAGGAHPLAAAPPTGSDPP